jgi:hypothetical protein
MNSWRTQQKLRTFPDKAHQTYCTRWNSCNRQRIGCMSTIAGWSARAAVGVAADRSHQPPIDVTAAATTSKLGVPPKEHWHYDDCHGEGHEGEGEHEGRGGHERAG